MEKKLILKSSINSAKPNNYKDKQISCPFCDFDELRSNREVFCDFGDSLLISNKFGNIDRSIQCLFIETDKCNHDFNNYSPEKTISVLKNFFLSHQTLKNSYPNKDIIAFKNFGPHSSGSIVHQHMQLFVLEEPLNHSVDSIHFEGDSIFSNGSIDISFSSLPITELYEINISIKNDDLLSFNKTFDDFCLLLQESFKFTLDTITNTESLNLIFYFLEDRTVIKILPRNHKNSHSHTPIFLGFRIHLTPDDLPFYGDWLKKRFKKLKLNTF